MKIIQFALALALGGCTATTTGLQPTSKLSGFDGARVVNIQPHGTACTSMNCIAVGAQWSSATPTTALLQVSYPGRIVAITGARLSINGKFVEATPGRNPTGFSDLGTPLKASTRDFAIPLATLREIASAQKAWIRVSTTEGYSEDAIVDGSADSKALHAIRRFLAEIDNGAGWDRLNPPQK